MIGNEALTAPPGRDPLPDMPGPAHRSITTTRQRPDLVPVVAQWLWNAFWRSSGRSFGQTLDAVKHSVVAPNLPRTFILLVDDVPAGTVSLAEHDLDERPDLTPWLAGLYVAPDQRGHGLAGMLIKMVEQECRIRGIPTVWLYTNTAERLYERAGWRTVELIDHHATLFSLMRRDLA